LERETYTFDKTYGFTLWRPGDAAADHAGTPAVRVALAYDLEPGQIDDRVRQTIRDYPDLSLKRQEVDVARGHAGGRSRPGAWKHPLYGGLRAGEGEGVQDQRLLRKTGRGRGGRPRQCVALFFAFRTALAAGVVVGSARRELRRGALRSGGRPRSEGPCSRGEAGEHCGRAGAERHLRGRLHQRGAAHGRGCYLADPDFFVQTQQGRYANGRPGDGIPTGYTIIGKPNYWGEYTHGSIGMGRCEDTNYTNDMFAVDYPLNRGDAIFTPFKCGTATFAGRNETHSAYGIMVTIRACNGEYVSLAGHLDSLAAGIYRGAKIADRNEVIRYAGNTGGL
jgi:hypothetical protein